MSAQSGHFGRPAVKIGDTILDAAGVAWTCLNAPDGSGVCDGLFRREAGWTRQQYGEHIPAPWIVLGQSS